MSIFDPRQTGSGQESARNPKREAAPFPTKFGRDGRRRLPRPVPTTRGQGATRESQSAPDDESPFEDHGGR